MRPLLQIFALAILTVACLSCAPAPATEPLATEPPPGASTNTNVEQLRHDIAEMLIVGFRGQAVGECPHIRRDIERYHIGGVILFEYDAPTGRHKRNISSPSQLASLCRELQSLAPETLLIGIDQEGGRVNRLREDQGFPHFMSAKQSADYGTDSIRHYAALTAAQLQKAGVNLNFAPCVDVDVNPDCPVIGKLERSFSKSPKTVADAARIWIDEQRKRGVVSCLKHFPGHGDTETDSHLGLPTIRKSRAQLEEMELYPYRQLLGRNPEMVMVAHLHIPSLDDSHQSVSSLSYPIVTGLLKQELGYSGLVVTDGLEMKGVRNSNRFEGDIEIRALLAGADLLLLPGETGAVIQAVKSAVDSGIIPLSLIDERCLRVLSFKEMKGLWNCAPVDLQQVYAELNAATGVDLNGQIEAKALTLLANKEMLPISPAEVLRQEVALLCIGRDEYKAEYRRIANKYGLPFYWLPKKYTKDYASVLASLQSHKKVIVLFGGSNQLAGSKYGVDDKVTEHLRTLARSKPTVLLHLGNPYALDQFGSTASFRAVMVAYQFTPSTVRSALRACFGEIGCEGVLPVSTKEYPSGTGLGAQDCHRECSLLPASVTLRLDKLLQEGVRDKVYPGCVVMVLQNGVPIYQKAFGHLTYDTLHPVTLQTMYDVASLTKPSATTLAVMKLYDEHRIELTDPIGLFLPYLKGTDKANITLAELLTHTSGMPAFIPFYKSIQGKEQYFHRTASPEFSVKVADSLYLLTSYPDSIRLKVAHCKLGAKKYEYSDLNFLLLKDMVETLTERPMDEYLAEFFYRPMGLERTCFNPLDKGFGKEDIAPTENDEEFRRQVVQGYVHDQTAALMNGNAGNAGLFTTAGELGALFLMIQNGGIYNAQRYLSEATVEEFTKMHPTHNCRVRGLGFHTPKAAGESALIPSAADLQTFGHQGFTGTVVWCDPKEELIFVFLSNRVCPNAEPNKLAQSKIRLKSHELIYQGLTH